MMPMPYTAAAPPKPKAGPPQPKLVLTLVLNQFRYDYTTRFRAEYTGGLDRLLTQGAVFTNANFILVTNLPPVVPAFVAGYLYLTRERRAFQRCDRAYRRAQRVRKKSPTASKG